MSAPHYKPIRAFKIQGYMNGIAAILGSEPAHELQKRAFALGLREMARPGCFIQLGGTRWHACPGTGTVKGACNHE